MISSREAYDRNEVTRNASQRPCDSQIESGVIEYSKSLSLLGRRIQANDQSCSDSNRVPVVHDYASRNIGKASERERKGVALT